MIDLSILEVDNDMLDTLEECDMDSDGILEQSEIANISDTHLETIKASANTNKEWDLIRQISLSKGYYRTSDGFTKPMRFWGGGRSALLVDRLKAVQGMSDEQARAIAGKVARMKLSQH